MRKLACCQISEVVHYKNDTPEGVEPNQEAHGAKVKSSPSPYKDEINYGWSRDRGETSNKKRNRESNV